MRNHKIAMIFALSLCLLALAGCVDNSGESDNLPVQSNHIHNILSIRNAAGDIVHYGMNRADVERVLGPGEPSLGNFYFHEISDDADIAILYRDDIVAAIMLRGDTGWMLANGAYVGMQIYDQQGFYGITIEENRQFIRQLMGMDESQIPSSINFRFVLEDGNYLRMVSYPLQNKILNNLPTYVIL